MTERSRPDGYPVRQAARPFGSGCSLSLGETSMTDPSLEPLQPTVFRRHRAANSTKDTCSCPPPQLPDSTPQFAT